MIKNIIFSGCAFKCWAYIGTIRALREHKTPELEHIIGVSAGGIFGLFYILGISWEYLLDFFINLNFNEIKDVDIDNILVQESILAGLKFIEKLKTILSTKINPDVTFSELKYFTKVKFTVNAINISESKLEYFNSELTPDVKVIDAIIASASIPVLFPPHQINKKLYYDGGICNNCPVDLVEEINTIAFDIAHYNDNNDNDINLLNLLQSLVNIVNNSINRSNYNIYNILPKSFDNQSRNLQQTKDDIFNLYMHGYLNTKRLLFDFSSLKND